MRAKKVKKKIENLCSRRSNGNGGGPSKCSLLSPWVKALNFCKFDSFLAATPDELDVPDEVLVFVAAAGSMATVVALFSSTCEGDDLWGLGLLLGGIVTCAQRDCFRHQRNEAQVCYFLTFGRDLGSR